MKRVFAAPNVPQVASNPYIKLQGNIPKETIEDNYGFSCLERILLPVCIPVSVNVRPASGWIAPGLRAAVPVDELRKWLGLPSWDGNEENSGIWLMPNNLPQEVPSFR